MQIFHLILVLQVSDAPIVLKFQKALYNLQYPPSQRHQGFPL